MSSPQSCATLTGTPIITAAHRPTRSARRTMRGSLAPKACAARGATAETGPMPNTNPTNKMSCARLTAAMAASPSRPMRTRSVVIMATWPSWVSAIGQASLTVSIVSARQTARTFVAADPAAVMVPGNVMARHHNGCRGERKAQRGDFSAAPRRDEEFAVAVAADNGRGDDAFDLPAVRGDERGDVVADRG